jgi:WD40 repeat protein
VENPRDRPEMATASSDGSVRLWQVPGCRQTLGFEVARDTARDLAFHPSRPELAAAFSSGLLRIFDTSKSTVAHTIRQHTAPVSACLFKPSGKELLTLGGPLSSACLFKPQGQNCRRWVSPFSPLAFSSHQAEGC